MTDVTGGTGSDRGRDYARGVCANSALIAEAGLLILNIAAGVVIGGLCLYFILKRLRGM